MMWKFLMKIYSLEIFPWDFSFWRFVHRDFSLKIYFGDFSIEFLKNFNEDLFIGDFSLKNSYGDFSFDDLNIFNEDLFIGDFFFEKLRFFLEIFPFEDLFMEIFPWRFILEIFPMDLWKFFKKICSWRFFHWSFQKI